MIIPILSEPKLDTLFQAIETKHQYSFIHDEMGPDEHVLIDQKGEVVLIEGDGCKNAPDYAPGCWIKAERVAKHIRNKVEGMGFGITPHRRPADGNKKDPQLRAFL